LSQRKRLAPDVVERCSGERLQFEEHRRRYRVEQLDRCAQAFCDMKRFVDPALAARVGILHRKQYSTDGVHDRSPLG
jgi:hypothetical protein